MHGLTITVLSLLVLTGCERLQKPTVEQCTLAVENLISKNVSTAIDSEFPTSKDDDPTTSMAAEFLKGVGANVLTEVLKDDVKVAWCELNMSVHDVNCLRSAQNKASVDACGFGLGEKGEIVKR